MESNLAHETHQERVAAADEAVAELHRRAVQDPYRLKYHFNSPGGWINDPNGLIYFRGAYHLFYQTHPYSANNGPKHWGHAVSTNLVDWESLPIALAPSFDFEVNGCFSGTAVEHDGQMVLFYTGNVNSRPKQQVQCVATSEDGLVFHKFEGNPVIPKYPPEGSPDFRDPKVWHHSDTWYMAVGSGKDGRGNLLLYKSTDLYTWTYVGVMLEGDASLSYVWNCPDFVSFGDKDVVLIAPAIDPGQRNIRQGVYFVGQMDYDTGHFHPEFDADIDGGFDFYAPQMLVDDKGRVILIGWMDMWWNAMPTQDYDWAGSMTLPRLVSMRPDGKLRFDPVPELEQLRTSHTHVDSVVVASDTAGYLPGVHGDALEFLMTFDVRQSTATEFGLQVRCSENGAERTKIGYRPATGELTVDRSQSGIGDMDLVTRPIPVPEDGKLTLHIYLDTSSVEVYTGDGQVISSRIYPDPTSTGVDLYAVDGKSTLESVDVWTLRGIERGCWTKRVSE